MCFWELLEKQKGGGDQQAVAELILQGMMAEGGVCVCMCSRALAQAKSNEIRPSKKNSIWWFYQLKGFPFGLEVVLLGGRYCICRWQY